MQSLTELEQTPQVIAYKAELARVEKERVETLEQVYQPAKLIANKIHANLLEIFWDYASHPDTTAHGMHMVALKFEEVVEEAIKSVDEHLCQ